MILYMSTFQLKLSKVSGISHGSSFYIYIIDFCNVMR